MIQNFKTNTRNARADISFAQSAAGDKANIAMGGTALLLIRSGVHRPAAIWPNHGFD
jgi:hypothetical protein